MYVEIASCDDSGQKSVPIVLNCKDENFTVPVFCMSLQSDILLNVYSFKIEMGAKSVKPFVGFYENKLILFCNNVYDLDLNEIAYDWRLSNATGQFPQFNYSGNFSQYEINQHTYKIVWHLGKKFDYQFPEDDNDIFTIIYDGKTSRFETMTRVLRDIYTPQINDFLHKTISKMGLADKILSINITDCPGDEETLPNGTVVRALDDGCTGLCAPQAITTSCCIFPYDFKNCCKVYYHPHIFYQTLQTLKFLLVHELCHAKIGCQHRHDKIFWYMFEVFTGMEKTVDWAWRQEQCNRDNQIVRERCGIDVNQYLLQYQKQYKKPANLQKIRNFDVIGAYSGLYDKNRQFTAKRYKTRLIELVMNIDKFIKMNNYLEAAYVVEYFFEWNNMAKRFTQNYDLEDQIIIDDIVNCCYKIYFSVRDQWQNMESVCKIQIGKIYQLIEVLSDPVEIPNPENILLEVKAKRDYIMKQISNAQDDVNDMNVSRKRHRS